VFDIKIVLPKDLQERAGRAVDLITSVLMNQYGARSVLPSPTLPTPMALVGGTEFGPSREDQEWLDQYMKQIEPELRQQSEELLRTQVRESLLLGGNLRRLKEAIRKGQKPKIVRKREGRRDPLYIQLGDGIAETMEEIYLFG
jgi:hypothetical protein